MNRRQFSAHALGLGLRPVCSPLAVPRAQAQGAPVEGKHYVRLAQPLPVAARAARSR